MSDCRVADGKQKYDVAVIGAGAAGFSAAITAANQGARVAFIGHGAIGTGVNIECVPSKALIRAMEVLHSARAAQRFNGIEAIATVADWRAVVQQKQALVDDIRQAKFANLLRSYSSISYIEGQAAFDANGTLTADGVALNASKIIIATGARPAIPAIKGIDSIPYLTCASALELETLPKSLIVIGAGPIAAEIAQILSRAGVKVVIVSRRGLLPEAEPEIREALSGYFVEEGIEVIVDIEYDLIEAAAAGVKLTVLSSGTPRGISAERVLIATGQAANVESLNLAAAGVELSSKGGIKVDPRMRTTRSDVYAAGDVTGTDQSVHMATEGARIAARNAIHGNLLTYDNRAVPAVVFTDPQVASVGITEAAAREQGLNVRTSVLSFDNVAGARIARDTRGLIKLVAHAKSGKLLGAHILAPDGADSIQTATMAIKAGMTYSDLAETAFPYLTKVEGLKLAAQTFDTDAVETLLLR